MKKALLLIFRILIPIICVATAAAFYLPAVSLSISKDNLTEINDYLSAYNEAQGEDKEAFENSGRIEVYSASEDNNISLVEIMLLHSKTAGCDKAAENTNADVIYNGVITAVNDNYILIFTLMSVSVIFLITTLIFAVVKSNRLLSLLAMIFSVIFLAVNASVIAVIYMVITPSFNGCELLNAEVSPLVYTIAAGALLVVILCIVLMILERLSAPKVQMEYVVPSVAPEMTVTLDHKTIANVNMNGNLPVGTTVSVPAVKPCVTCLKGSCEGLTVPIENGEVIFIGRDAQSCNVIVNHPKVSRRHCSVSYDRRRNYYIVTDLSHNGTFTENGEKLLKDHSNILQNGSVMYLYNKDNLFRLGQ